MNQVMGIFLLLHVHLLLLLLRVFIVSAQSPSSQDDLPTQDVAKNGFQTGLAVVIGILSVMFFFTFILLFYAKCCNNGSSSAPTNQQIQDGLLRSRPRLSGIDKTVIESLPFFRFLALKGSREGLECAVCLSKFEDIEILRLLPKCKHAFHMECVDTWLEKHSSCPLCRHKFSTDDLSLSTYSDSLRFLWDQSELHGDSYNLELFVEREEDRGGSSRFSVGSSFRKFLKSKEEEESEEEIPIQESSDMNENEKVLHKFNHKILVSQVVLNNRWSSVSSSDFIVLNSEMLNAMSNHRFTSLDHSNDDESATRTIKDGGVMDIKEMEMNRVFDSNFNGINQNDSFSFPGFPSSIELGVNGSRILNPVENRSMSDIIMHPRFTGFNTKSSSSNGDSSLSDEHSARQERAHQIWLPIAQRTVQWFVNREKRTPHAQNQKQDMV